MSKDSRISWTDHTFNPWWGCVEDGSLWLDWVIVGGESGPRRRPLEVQWVRDIAAECEEFGVPVWVKQDSTPYPGRQGRLPPALWNLKQLPGEASR
ncbi:MAG: DUF5131 family protein [Deltaproteobacteria bacterium]|nr:DUF5131 family protein [Deltaproteobacteria bacterium]